MTATNVDDLTDPLPRLTDSDFDGDAVSWLRAWYDVVRALPTLISEDARRQSIRSLVVWYERVFEEEGFAFDPPLEGLDILIDEPAVPTVPSDVHAELARARWAIRVGEELVKWRVCHRYTGPDSAPAVLAADRLDLAIQEACRQIERQP